MRARPMVIATVKTALNLLDAGSRVRHLPALLPMSETHVPPCERLLGRADRRECVPRVGYSLQRAHMPPAHAKRA